MRHSIKSEILQTVLNYLASRPYAEVAKLVADIQGDVKVVDGSDNTEAVEEIAAEQ